MKNIILVVFVLLVSMSVQAQKISSHTFTNIEEAQYGKSTQEWGRFVTTPETDIEVTQYKDYFKICIYKKNRSIPIITVKVKFVGIKDKLEYTYNAFYFALDVGDITDKIDAEVLCIGSLTEIASGRTSTIVIMGRTVDTIIGLMYNLKS